MENKTKIGQTKNAFVDQIILWIVLFTVFVGLLFFVIDYSNAVKVKDNTDAIADYTARMVALEKSDTLIAEGINTNIKDAYFQDISESSITCTEDTTVSNHQVIVNVYTTLVNDFLSVGNNNVHARTVVFNERSEFKKECSITLLVN
jgi:Flp pilus assembly protein TadG